MLTAEQVERQKESLSPEIKARLAEMAAKREQDRKDNAAREARRMAEDRERLRNPPLSEWAKSIPVGGSRSYFPSEAQRQKGYGSYRY